MPWKVINPMDAKTEFVLRAMRQDSDFGRLCRSRSETKPLSRRD